jgi:hypothetical protein
MANYIKRLLVETLVRRRRAVPIALHRTLTLEASTVILEDALCNTSGLVIETVAAGDKFATIHMGSSRYFQEQELSLAEPAALDGAAGQLTARKLFKRSQAWSFE